MTTNPSNEVDLGGLAHSPTLTANSSQSDNSEYKRALELNKRSLIEWHGMRFPIGTLAKYASLEMRPNPYTKKRLSQQNAQKRLAKRKGR